MKKFLVIAVLVAALTAAFATSAFAAAPTTPTTPVPAPGRAAGFGYGAGSGIHAPGTGLAQRRRRRAPAAGRRNGPATMKTLRSILGLTVEQLQAERLSGKSLAQIAAGKGIDENTLIAKLLDARKASVNDLLSAGKITQAQADYMLSNMAEHVKLHGRADERRAAGLRRAEPDGGDRAGTLEPLIQLPAGADRAFASR